eukprot:GFUD01033732.1.p1 GENE.GFUD01033732.1~~GFUD01033732.1.p1  ORF type:complete len:321 (+),score=59.67 GFUD01033732.1:139-1101(+)
MEMSSKEAGENVSDPGDPCNSYEWSIVFCLIMTLSIVAWIMAIIVIIHSRQSKGGNLSGLDKLSCLLALATLIQFGPILSHSLHAGHNTFSYSQTGCKLMFYTDHGTRHVITALVCGLVAYAYYGLHHGFESVNGRLGSLGMGWVLLGLAALQGLFGMVPAMYVDLAPNELNCIWTISMKLTLGQVVSMDLILRSLSPYLVPCLLVIYPVMQLTKLLPGVEEKHKSATVRTILTITVSYFALNSPYAVNLIVEYALHLSSSPHSFAAVCNFKWFFFLVHQVWFIVAPLMLIKGDPTVEMESVKQWIVKFRKISDDKAQLV